jgi:nucleotide-binding universal stress UspA family protein
VIVRTIVVPLDGTPHALTALPVARALADLEGATVHVAHVGEQRFPARRMIEELGLTPQDIRGWVFDQPTETSAAAGIVRLARDRPDPAIVLCTHTGVDKSAGALGGVAESVLRNAPCPLVLVHPERGLGPWALHRILLPHDGTPSSVAAMDPAGELAHRAGAEILVLHIAAPGAEIPTEPGTLTTPRYVDQPQHEWPQWSAAFIDRMTALGHPPDDVVLRLSLATGDPAEEIVRFARSHDADLIALAWHGHWEPERAATLKAVIRGAGVPILVIRARAEAAAGRTLST